MWTTKRVVLLFMGFALFTVTYVVYAFFLGAIDGLPELPEKYLAQARLGDDPPQRIPQGTLLTKLQMAFGDRDQILQSSIKLEVNTKRLVLASEYFEILEDGRAKLYPFHLAVFGKDAGDGKGKLPEINTIESEVAFLTFDKPIHNPTEINGRKLVAAELSGDIKVRNNRKTPQQDDDLSLTTQGPMFYSEPDHLIWTAAPVRLVDTQSKPEPTIITATGMDLHLTADKPADSTRKPGKETVSGVDTIGLREHVTMHLIDANSSFLSGNKPADPKAKTAPAGTSSAAPASQVASKTAPPTDPAKIIITTAGPFLYDVRTDHARFDIPQRHSMLGELVTVVRQSGPPDQVKEDRLTCDHLELQFQRKSDAKPNDGEHSMDLAIETAHATGQLVKLTSDAEGLYAFGDDFFHNAQTHVSVLKGSPMVALKDGHQIKALELHMVNAGQKDAQQAQAKGPGEIALLDGATGKRHHYAYWQELLTFTKEGDYDCLTLTNDAKFEDREQNQWLKADRLKVWLQPADQQPTNPPPPAAANEQQRMRPHHLEATGHVSAHSDEMDVVDLPQHPTDHLLVWFEDVPAKTQLPPAEKAAAPAQAAPAPVASNVMPPIVAPPSGGVASVPEAAKPATPGPAPETTTANAPPLPAAASHDPLAMPTAKPQAANTPPAEKKKPMVLRARFIETWVRRTGEQSELDKLRCQGDVYVHQDPSDPTDKTDQGVDIYGKTLNLDHAPEGSVLVVTGDLAQVQLNKITIFGNEVNIDQRTNKSWVPGRGVMRMLTTGSSMISGDNEKKEQRPPVPAPAKKEEPKVQVLTVHWTQDMFFTGQHALFRGNVQATQERSNLLCQEMQVFLDRPVSFKESEKKDPKKGDKDAPPAKVKELVCDGSVRLEEEVVDEKEQLVRRTRLIAPAVALNNEDGVMNAMGPGVLHILQYGSTEEFGPSDSRSPAAAKPQQPVQELKLTRINYLDKLYADNVKHTAKFYGGVEVVQLPANSLDVPIDPDHPSKGMLYMKSDQLQVFSHKLPDGRSTQEMISSRRCVVQSQEFWGTSDQVKYEESKDQVILEGGDGGKATLFQEKVPGGPPSKLVGHKIYYWRRSNEFRVEGGGVMDTIDHR